MNPASPVITTLADRPELTEAASRFPDPFWPIYMHKDPIANRFFGQVYARFPQFQLVMLASDAETIIAVGNSIPLAFDGSPNDLPDDGWDWAIEQGIHDAEAGRSPRSLCALQIVVDASRRAQGLSTPMVHAMRNLALTHGLARLLAPVRPNRKTLYPLTSIDEYIRWTTADHLPFDPWLRVHIRLGAEIVKVCPRAMTIPGTVDQWEQWTGLAFPVDGSYAIPGALAPIVIDHKTDAGLYIEPNVWVWHSLSAGGHI